MAGPFALLPPLRRRAFDLSAQQPLWLRLPDQARRGAKDHGPLHYASELEQSIPFRLEAPEQQKPPRWSSGDGLSLFEILDNSAIIEGLPRAASRFSASKRCSRIVW